MTPAETDTLLLEAAQLLTGDRSFDELKRLHGELLPDLAAAGLAVRVPRGWILSQCGADRLLTLEAA